MVFNVRCFKCGEHQVRLVLGGRAVIHARCQACESNLLAEVMEFERDVALGRYSETSEEVEDCPEYGEGLDVATETDGDVVSAGRR